MNGTDSIQSPVALQPSSYPLMLWTDRVTADEQQRRELGLMPPRDPPTLSAPPAPLGNPTACTALTKPQTHDLSQVPPPVGPAAQPTACQPTSSITTKPQVERREPGGSGRDEVVTGSQRIGRFIISVSSSASLCFSDILSLLLRLLHTPAAAKTEKTEWAPESNAILAIQTGQHPPVMLMSRLTTVAT